MLVDLGALLATGREVGTDAVLLLLTVHALSLRRDGDVPLRELQWTLGATRRELLSWLQKVEHSGLGVWTGGAEHVVLEVASSETERTLFGPDDEPGVLHRIPTHWFVRTLPLLGRRAFTVYLYLRSRERAGGLTAPLTVGSIQRACALRGLLQTRLALRRLTRAGLIASGGSLGRFVLDDPTPLTKAQRRWLARLSSGALPPTRAGRLLRLAVFVLLVILAVASILFLRLSL